MKLRIVFPFLLAFIVAFSSCDNNTDVKKPDKKEKEEEKDPNTLLINLKKDFTSWAYLNFSTGEVKTMKDINKWNYISKKGIIDTKEAAGSMDDLGMDWDIAFHYHREVKTNGGMAVATEFTKWEDAKTIPNDGYQADEKVENTIVTDLSKMMQGAIGYAAESNLNKVLSTWCDKKPTGGMPPFLYTPIKKVFYLKCKDGRIVKLWMTENTNDEGTTGFVKLKYQIVKDNK